MTQAEEMRQQRNNEAKELIGSRVGTAKAIFSQNSASGQMLLNKAAPVKPVRNSIAQRINTLNQAGEPEAESPKSSKVAPVLVEREEEKDETTQLTDSPINVVHETKALDPIVDVVSEVMHTFCCICLKHFCLL